eukprot:TRINITY_DN4914_c1_g1_i2.p1 TRINITY_DN4914_c1_g1~~TRINITY_DN4914_c1_g1_i2.p1  ORF type:complete len:540 (+),score=48.63 TRINITY_DN4914_c1_g1_i2:117-1736(+)
MPLCELNELGAEFSTMWLLICGILVFLMQAGFLLLEVGQVRMNAHLTILLKNAMDAAICCIMWWAIGYAFAFGKGNSFIGWTYFFTSNYPNEVWFFADWFFNFAFAATTTTILSGAVAERCQIRTYLIYSALLSGVLYPVVAHWVWSPQGWLSPCRFEGHAFGNSQGLMDFAGSGVVHMMGGTGALIASFLLGPRLGRFTKFADKPYLEGYSVALATLGAFILWLSWFAFNAGSTMDISYIDIAGKICVNSTLAISASCLCATFLSYVTNGALYVHLIISSLLGGGVAISGPCAFVEPYAAFVIGIVAGVVYYSSSALLRTLKIDDPVEAIPVHFFCGIWGLISVGFFATETAVNRIFDPRPTQDWGVFYGGSGHQLGVQVMGVAVIIGWTTLFAFPLFYLLKQMNWLRIPIEEEVFYLSESKRGVPQNTQYVQERSLGIFSHQRETGPATFDMQHVVRNGQYGNQFNMGNIQHRQVQQQQQPQQPYSASFDQYSFQQYQKQQLQLEQSQQLQQYQQQQYYPSNLQSNFNNGTVGGRRM